MTPQRKELARFGRRGRLVRVLLGTSHGQPRVVVAYPKPGGGRAHRYWPDSRPNRQEAIQWAEGLYRGLHAPTEAPKLTLAQVWERFSASELEHCRPRTRRLYRQQWRLFENFAGPHLLAEDQTYDTMARFRTWCDERGYAVSWISRIMGTVRHVYRWADAVELITRNRVSHYVYRVAKEDRPESPDEFSAEEFARILAQLAPTKATHWRPWVALTICGYQGARQNAVLHLRWEDVDLEAGRITWRAEWDKTGRGWTQPIRRATREAFEIARQWGDKRHPGEPWVIPGTRPGQPYTISALWYALKDAEARAGVAHKPGRGGHGLRRLLAGQVRLATGDPLRALEAIGDKDLRQAPRYLKQREAELARVFERMDEA